MAAIAPPKNCPFCRLLLETTPETKDILCHVRCPRCGSYAVSYAELEAIERLLKEDDRPVFSHWIYEQNRLNMEPTIRSADIPLIARRHKFTFVERTKRFLLYLNENTVSPGDGVNILTPQIQAALQQFDRDYIRTIAHYLDEEKLVSVGPPGPDFLYAQPTQMVTLTPRGIMQAEEWGRSYTASMQGFVAMWFHKKMEHVWKEGFYPAIDRAGYTPQRIDNKEHVNKICDEIIAEIRRSRFVVADFTGQRGGVYYEAGYANGRDIPVIWTCHKEELSKLHFDIRQYNCIDWETPQELAHRLQVRIEAVIGEGPRKQPA
jgi:hypothetical protein